TGHLTLAPTTVSRGRSVPVLILVHLTAGLVYTRPPVTSCHRRSPDVCCPGCPDPDHQPPKLLDRLRLAALAHFARPEPADRYVECVRRFILFHGKRHPRDLGLPEVGRFLDHLARTQKDPVDALQQAREALGFLYRRVLYRDPGELPFPEPPRLLDRVR